jgi:hypothetical protein
MLAIGLPTEEIMISVYCFPVVKPGVQRLYFFLILETKVYKLVVLRAEPKGDMFLIILQCLLYIPVYINYYI